MSDKISDKMTSALLAMSLSYYYVMEEHVEKETRMDEILSTLLNCSKNKMHTSTEQTKGKCKAYTIIIEENINFGGIDFDNFYEQKNLNNIIGSKQIHT